MKYFYLTILTLFTITHTHAANPRSPIDESLTGGYVPTAKMTAFRPVRGTPPPSESGSYTGSHGVASTIIGRHEAYTPVEVADQSELVLEYNKLMAAYQQLLQITSATDTRLIQFVGVVESILPNGIDRASADEDSLVSLQTAFRQLTSMYRALNRSYNKTTGETKVLESTVAELNAGQEELLATMATMAKRPTEHMETDMSPERVKAIREAEADSSAVVEALRARNAELEADKARLAAENAALKAAATKPAAKSSTGASKDGVREPLLTGTTGGYTRLDDQSTHRKKKEDGCPCNVM